MKLWKRKTKKVKEPFLKKAYTATGTYLENSISKVSNLGYIFGKHKILGFIGFFLQPIIAIGQLVFGYSFFITIAYMIIYNYFLLKMAKTKRQEGGENVD